MLDKIIIASNVLFFATFAFRLYHEKTWKKKFINKLMDQMHDRMVIIVDHCPKCNYDLNMWNQKKRFDLLDQDSKGTRN